ncbi:MAG: SLBB domain-containing protein, partial [Odoribacter sp.]
KRPLIYEMKNPETIENLLSYAGGFSGDAFKTSIRVIRKSGREHQIFNVEDTDFGKFILTDGDKISVDSVLDRFENRIEIKGAVYRAGLYALGDHLTSLKQLIEKSEGIRGDAFTNRAVLYREKPNRTQEVIAVDLNGLLEGKVADIPLCKNDVFYIPSIFDLKEDYSVNIWGAVGIPGTYKYADNLTIEDLIVQAGGLKESASTVKIDIARRIKNPTSTAVGTLLSENYTLTLKDGLIVDGKKDFTLQPFDEVFVRNSPDYQIQRTVGIQGEVLFEGQFVLSKKGERLSDLIQKAGGLTPEAYVSGARLIRKMNNDERLRVETLLKLTKQSGRDSVDVNRLDIGDTYYVGIELNKALKNPGSDYDIVLREGDVLNVPEYSGTVKISGAVMYPNTVVYAKNAKLNHYIGQGGGFADRAKKRRAFIVYMNGTVARSKTFNKANAAPGCEIIVPVKPTRKGVGLAEIMGIASSTTSMAALVTSILNNTK